MSRVRLGRLLSWVCVIEIRFVCAQEEPAIIGTLCCVIFLGNSPQHGPWSWLVGIGAAVGLLVYRIVPEPEYLAKQEVLDAKLGISILVVVLSVYAAVLGALNFLKRFPQRDQDFALALQAPLGDRVRQADTWCWKPSRFNETLPRCCCHGSSGLERHQKPRGSFDG